MKLVCVIASAVFFIVGVVPAVLGQEKAGDQRAAQVALAKTVPLAESAR